MIGSSRTLDFVAAEHFPFPTGYYTEQQMSIAEFASRFFPELCNFDGPIVHVNVEGEHGEKDTLHIDATRAICVNWRPVFITAEKAGNEHGIIQYCLFMAGFDSVLHAQNLFHEAFVRKYAGFRYIEGEGGLCLDWHNYVPEGRIVRYEHASFVESQDTIISVYSLLTDRQLQMFLETAIRQLPKPMKIACKIFIWVLDRFSL